MRRWINSLRNLITTLVVVLPVYVHAQAINQPTFESTDRARLLAACNSTDFASTVIALPAGAPEPAAKAFWLDEKTLYWPLEKAENQTSVQYVLAHSSQGQLVAKPGQKVAGADQLERLQVLPQNQNHSALSARFKWVSKGVVLTFANDVSDAPLNAQKRSFVGQQLLVKLSNAGEVLEATYTQTPGALDAQYGSAAAPAPLGARRLVNEVSFSVWAPTARRVSVCTYATHDGVSSNVELLSFDTTSGIWRTKTKQSDQFYTYLVEVFVPSVGWVLNRVTDPYSLSLTTNSMRSAVIDLNTAATQPKGWNATAIPARVKRNTDMVVYELHVRDFSINDLTVPALDRGKFTAFAHSQSNGMQHLKRLSKAGVTDIHLQPIFDFATVPESGCVEPAISGEPAGLTQQAAVQKTKETDCFNWGYDPLHYTAPEGSYSTNPADPATRVRQLRTMVQQLHRANLRVGMDVVYNHASAAGQHPHSVLDRIVPGYYHRLNQQGQIERSTCCDNTATEHRMMAKLMIDSVVVWARDYKIDSFRFDLMGHQPRSVMLELQKAVNMAAGRPVQLLGEGWNFGEVANGARFDQAAQGVLNGTGIGTFSDRARDAIRGGGPSDNNMTMVTAQGYVNGLGYLPNEANKTADIAKARAALMHAADLVRVGLAGSIKSYRMLNSKGQKVGLDQIEYNGMPAGYVSEPSEVVNYVENHDNQTLFDINVFKLPLHTSEAERARVQMLAFALNMFSQGLPYFHAGGELLRSKSLDRNSYDSGDWFNRIDWSERTNYFGQGLPLAADNSSAYDIMRPLLADQTIQPTPQTIAWTRRAFEDLLQIRSSSVLFRLPTAQAIEERLKFYNTGAEQNPTLIVAAIDGTHLPSSRFKTVLYAVNVDTKPQSVTIDALQGLMLQLHPVHLKKSAADQRVAQQARFEAELGRLTIPARSAVVFVR